MKDYLQGWKNVKDVYIPPVKQKGFKENVIIRKYMPAKKVERIVMEMEEDDARLAAKKISTGYCVKLIMNYASKVKFLVKWPYFWKTHRKCISNLSISIIKRMIEFLAL